MLNPMKAPAPERILFIRPSALGDVCRSVPVVANLKKKWPDAKIDWLVQSEFQDAIASHPAIHEVIPFHRTAFRKWYFPTRFFGFLAFLKRLKAKKYDLVIDAQGLGRSGLMSWATRAKERIGPATAREFGWLGYTSKIQTSKRHTVEQMVALCKAVGAPTEFDMQLVSSQEERAWWQEQQVQQYVVLAPTSRWLSKQWPIERYTEVAKHLISKGCTVVVVGAPSESGQVETLCAHEGVINLLPKMTVGRLLAVIESSRLVIANDSAALHIAVGFSRPCIGLFGPTDPEKVGPYMQDDAVLRSDVDYERVHFKDRSLGQQFMEQIEVDEVLDKIDDLIGTKS